LGMAVALLMPYVIAFLLYVPDLLADLGGLVLALLSIPFISIVVIVIAYLWYHNEYWLSDVTKTSPNVLAFLFIIGYPIAFSLTLNSSMGIYFVGAYLIVIFAASYLYKWQPRVPIEIGYKMGLFWAGVVAVAVLLITSLLDTLNRGLSAWLSEMLSLDWYKHVMMYSMAAWLATKLGYTSSLQIIPSIGLYAFVVGFSEEGWARLSIPLVAKYFDDNVILSVWWLGTTWLSLHAVVIALLIGLSIVPINLFILSLISIFIFYVFAKTGDYIATAIAHGFYDLMISLGFIGLALGIAFIVMFRRYYKVP